MVLEMTGVILAPPQGVQDWVAAFVNCFLRDNPTGKLETQVCKPTFEQQSFAESVDANMSDTFCTKVGCKGLGNRSAKNYLHDGK